MNLNKKKLFDDIVKILEKSDIEEVKYNHDMLDDAYSNCSDSFLTTIASESTYDNIYEIFKDQFIYHAADGFIYVESGADESACQLRLDFNNDSYKYDSCEIPSSYSYFEFHEEYGHRDDYDYLVQDFYEKNTETDFFTGSVFEALEKFNRYRGKIFKINKADYMEESESDKVTKDFIYNIDDSNKLSVTDNDLESFFKSEDGEISIIAADTKIKLITINKVIKDGKEKYKFIVDITNSDSESFCIKAFIETKDQLINFIQNTVDSLRNYPQFSKYADDLENCL